MHLIMKQAGGFCTLKGCSSKTPAVVLHFLYLVVDIYIMLLHMLQRWSQGRLLLRVQNQDSVVPWKFMMEQHQTRRALQIHQLPHLCTSHTHMTDLFFFGRISPLPKISHQLLTYTPAEAP
jgi:hypothetical protein